MYPPLKLQWVITSYLWRSLLGTIQTQPITKALLIQILKAAQVTYCLLPAAQPLIKAWEIDQVVLWTPEILRLERGWTGSRPANCKPDATRPLFGQILTMFFRNIEPWECSLLFPWFQCVEQKAGAPVWLRLICGPRATSLAVCTIVVLLCHVCTSLYVVVMRLYVGHNITWRSARHTPLNCFQLWRWIPNAISKFGELCLLTHC